MKVKKLSIGTGGISVDIDLENNYNQKAAWQLYIELSTRISTISLEEEADEKTALMSIYKLFQETRQTLKYIGKEALEVAKLAILILNKVIRPFTTKWQNKICSENYLKFRKELIELEMNLNNYKKQLAEIAGIPDFVD